MRQINTLLAEPFLEEQQVLRVCFCNFSDAVLQLSTVITRSGR